MSYYEYASCQNPRCLKCAVLRGEIEPEMLDFLNIMLDGKDRSGRSYIKVKKGRISRFPPVLDIQKVA